MIYKNLSRTTKTFYGVTFKPGSSHEVSGYITNPDFITVSCADETPNAKKQATAKKQVVQKEKAQKGDELTSGTDCNK